MSRPQPFDDIQTYPLFPPARGLFNPYRAYNPLLARGQATSVRLWRLTRDLACIMEGMQALTGQDNTGTASHNKFMMTHKMASTSVIKMFYVYGQDLRQFPLDNSGAESVLTAAITPADTAARFGGVRFRKRILIATTTNGLWWIDPETNTARKAGITAPGSAVSLADGGAGAMAAGVYQYKVTYVDDQGHESNGNATAASITQAINKQVAVSSIPLGGTGIAKRRLYRTTAGGASFLFLTTIADNTTTTYADNTVDASLGALLDSDNTVPSDTLRAIANSRTRVYLMDMDGLTLWASKIDSATGLPNWQAYPSRLSLDMAFAGGRDFGKALWYLNGDLYVVGGLSVARVVGDVATGVNIEVALQEEGIFSPFAYDVISNGTDVEGVIFINNLKQLRSYNGSGSSKNIGAKVQGILDTINVDAGLDGPTLVHDPLWNCIYIGYGTTASAANNKSLAVDLTSGEAFEPGYEFNALYHCPFMRGLYGYRHQVAAIKGWYAAQTETPIYSSYPVLTFADNKMELFQWSPSPGDDIDFLDVQILVKGQSRASNVIPIAQIEWTFDGGGRFRKHYVPCDKRQLIDKDGESVVIMSGTLGIKRLGKYLTLRLSALSNTANTTNGFEIYALNVDARILNQNRDGRKGLGEGSRRTYA